MPLVSGVSHIKWHLPHSIHGEHRGRTAKCPIANHRVEYNYGRIVPVRIAIDRNGNLAECAIEFEVLQEFQIGGTGRDEKIVLGKVMLNLSEYVEESEAILRDIRPGTAGSRRKRSSFSTSGGGTATGGDYEEEEEVEEGVVRRYLMQESKVNSTLKIGVLMMQVDGERNFSAPPLKTAPVFGGIAGIMAGEQVEPTQDEGQPLPPTSSKSRDASELQDMYRRALAASWACQPGEMQADECIEDIFSGGDGSPQVGDAEGNGARNPLGNNTPTLHHRRTHSSTSLAGRYGREDSSPSGDDVLDMGSTLRPQNMRTFLRHARHHSGASDRSVGTITRGDASTRHREPPGKDDAGGELRTRSESVTSLATTLGSSDRGKEGFKRPPEVNEFEVRDDLVAWALPGTSH